MSTSRQGQPSRRAAKTDKKRSRSPVSGDDMSENGHASSTKKKQKQTLEDDDDYEEPGERKFIFQKDVNILMAALNKFNANQAVQSTQSQIDLDLFTVLIDRLKERRYDSLSDDQEAIKDFLRLTRNGANQITDERNAIIVRQLLGRFQETWES
jgi:hypothetical protein